MKPLAHAKSLVCVCCGQPLMFPPFTPFHVYTLGHLFVPDLSKNTHTHTGLRPSVTQQISPSPGEHAPGNKLATFTLHTAQHSAARNKNAEIHFY